MRFIFVIIGAPIVSVALFMLMAMLVNKPLVFNKAQDSSVYFDLVMSNQDKTVERKNRHKPKPPKPQLQKKQIALIKPVQVKQQVTQEIELPAIDLLNNVTAMAISLPGIMTSYPSQDAPLVNNALAVPLHRVNPIYPTKARRLGRQGYIVLAFEINESGSVDKIQIVEEKPKGLFARSAITALKKWKYNPMLVNDQAVRQTGQQVRLEFQLESN